MEYFQLLPFYLLTFHFMVLFYYLSVWLCMKFLPWLSSSFFNPPPRLPWFILQFYYYTLQSRALSKASILKEQEGGISILYLCVRIFIQRFVVHDIFVGVLVCEASLLLFLYHLSVSSVVCVKLDNCYNGCCCLACCCCLVCYWLFACILRWSCARVCVWVDTEEYWYKTQHIVDKTLDPCDRKS